MAARLSAVRRGSRRKGAQPDLVGLGRAPQATGSPGDPVGRAPQAGAPALGTRLGTRRKARRNLTADAKALAAARRLGRLVNGPTGGDVVALSPEERRLPKYLAVVGDVTEVSYKPSKRSQRGRWTWEHQSGDRGDGQPRAKGRPLLAVDPRTKRPVWVPFTSPMKLTKRGLVG